MVISGGINPVVEFPDPGTYEVYLNITDTICNLQDTAKKIITVYDALDYSIDSDTILCPSANSAFDIGADSYGSATEFIWATDIDFTNVVNSGIQDSIITVNPSVSTNCLARSGQSTSG